MKDNYLEKIEYMVNATYFRRIIKSMADKLSISYVAVEDSLVDLIMLEEIAAKYGFLHKKATFQSGMEAMAYLQKNSCELVFLDVEIFDLSGLNILKQMRQKVPMAVFITSYPEFAIDGFELAALDYIVKPLTEDRFEKCINRVVDYWRMVQNAEAYQVFFDNETLTIKEGHHTIKIFQQEIFYLEAMQDYTKVVTEDKNYLTLASLSKFMEKLSPDKFLRVHRSYAIAISKVKELHPNKLVCGGIQIPVGKTYRSSVTQLRNI